MRSLVACILFLFARIAIAQTTVTILDSNGNQTTGTLDKGNVFFHDSQGNLSYGTVRDGNVFLSSSKGDIVFGTINNGNVFLSDSKGVTTGTIRNGNIFLSNSDGSITTGSYRPTGDGVTETVSTTSGVPAQSQSDADRQRQIDQQNYDAGYAVGTAIGNVITSAIDHHREKKFCQKNPDRCSNGHVIRVASNPYAEQIAWLHADTKRLMEETRQSILSMQAKLAQQPSTAANAAEYGMTDWKPMVVTFCSTYPNDTYTDLDGTVKGCHH